MRRRFPRRTTERRLRRLLREERGAALVLALMILLTLTGLVLAFLSASGFEPQISRNHHHTVRARYVAEAGIEYAYDTLATNDGSWNDYLAGATCTQGAILGTPNSGFPGLGSAHGTFTVRLRNDCHPNDPALTGVALDTTIGACDAAAPGAATRDANCKVIVTSTGTIGDTTRTITVVVSRMALPPINGALAFPGIRANVRFGGSSFVIDGRDTRPSDNPGAPTGAARAVYGIAVNGSLPMLAAQVEHALASSNPSGVRGKDETDESATAQGTATVQSDGRLTSREITDFVVALRSTADVSRNVGSGDTASITDVGSTCSTDVMSSACWGTASHPKIVYVRGAFSETATPSPSLSVGGNSTGTGILIVENGSVEVSGSFRWDGLIIVTGRNVGIRFRGDGAQRASGATIVNELQEGGATPPQTDIQGHASILHSREALDLVLSRLGRRLVTVSGWTDR